MTELLTLEALNLRLIKASLLNFIWCIAEFCSAASSSTFVLASTSVLTSTALILLPSVCVHWASTCELSMIWWLLPSSSRSSRWTARATTSARRIVTALTWEVFRQLLALGVSPRLLNSPMIWVNDCMKSLTVLSFFIARSSNSCCSP